MQGPTSKHSVLHQNPILRALKNSRDPSGRFNLRKLCSYPVKGMAFSRTVSADLEAMSNRFRSALKQQVSKHPGSWNLRQELRYAAAVNFFQRAAETAARYLSNKTDPGSPAIRKIKVETSLESSRPEKTEISELMTALRLTKISRKWGWNDDARMSEYLLASEGLGELLNFSNGSKVRFDKCARLAASIAGRKPNDYKVLWKGGLI